MSNRIQNKIEAKEKSLSELFRNNKFFIDFFKESIVGATRK